ncbi:MAG: restriction endonuclease subunit S [Gammaproteobacteria bacterium]|nr:restriction endonuclease subunit S [Gammaproteobacteria bacterium]
MTVDKSSSVVPKLRFPEFQDAPEWKTPRGDTLFNPINNRNAAPGLPVLAITQEHGAIPRDQIDYHVSASEKSISSYKEVCKGDFIISLRSFQGGIEYSRYHGICSPAYVILRRKVGDGSDHFFRHFFKSERFIQQLTRNIEGIRDGKMISFAQFSEQLLPTPKPPEQQKIADCLGSLDDLIAAEDRKLEALRQHKQGLMQQLFPQPSETVPPLGVQSDWKTLSLPKVVFFQEGPGIMAADFHSTGIPLVRLSGLAEKCVTLDGCNFLDPHKVAQKWAHFRLAVDDLVISTSASFGRVSIATEAVAGAVFYTGLVRFRSTDKRLSNAYLKSFLESPNFLRQVESYAVGGGIKHFGPTHLRQMHIQLPPLFEQQRIADCLGSLDGLVSAMCRRLIFLRQHKQGLMQRLFPSLEGE